jgi:hypothetical protein
MSGLNFGLSFYIIEMDEETYSLYNAKTDKNIIFGEERDIMEHFLNLNEPSHPFLIKKEPETSLTFESMCDSEYDYASINSMNFEYTMYDPFFPDTMDELQMSFSFVNDSDNEESNREEADSILPFLPEEEQ